MIKLGRNLGENITSHPMIRSISEFIKIKYRNESRKQKAFVGINTGNR